MKLYVASLYQIREMDHSLVGVYSKPASAIAAGENAIREFTEKEPLLLDWDHEHPEHRYYYDGFTLTITEAELDKEITS